MEQLKDFIRDVLLCLGFEFFLESDEKLSVFLNESTLKDVTHNWELKDVLTAKQCGRLMTIKAVLLQSLFKYKSEFLCIWKINFICQIKDHSMWCLFIKKKKKAKSNLYNHILKSSFIIHDRACCYRKIIRDSDIKMVTRFYMKTHTFYPSIIALNKLVPDNTSCKEVTPKTP